MRKKSTDLFRGWRIAWKYISANKKDLIILTWIGIFSALANGTAPYVMGKFFDAILDTHMVSTVTFEVPLWGTLMLFWGVLQITALITDWFGDLRSEKFGMQIFNYYKINAFSHLLFLPVEFHKNRKVGEIFDNISRAGDGIYSISRHILIHLAPKFLSIIVGFTFAFYINSQLATVLVIGVLLYIFTIVRSVPKALPLDRAMNKQYGVSYAFAHEAVNNFSIVKQFNAELFQKLKVKDSFMRADNFWISLAGVWSTLDFSSRVIVFLSQLIIFVLSVIAINAGVMTLGSLVTFSVYSAMVFGPFVSLGKNWQTLQNGLVALESTEEILSLPTEVYEPKNSISPKEAHGGIEFKNVSFKYKKGNQVLGGVSFETSPGQMVALVGESGAGKSTLIDLISAYYFPTKGEVLIDGVATNKWKLKSLRDMIAIVPQEVSLFNDTITKNLAYGQRRQTKSAIERAVAEAHADVFIEKFPKKYEQIVGERGVKLSVGQKQRIAIARAILRNPKILILDEPTSALDSETEKYVTEALERVMKGRTTFVIAHRLSTVRKADKILVLENGKIIESGNHEELMKIENGNYRRRYEMHVGLV